MTAPLPGGVALSALQVYPWEAADGICGGSPHMHLCCTEAYIVTGGAGRLQTLTTSGFAEQSLGPGDVVWFTPGTIHRAVNDGGLEILVLMENSGLPESGDAVLTLPPDRLADRASYDRAIDLAGPDDRPSPDRARERRDLAVAGFTELAAGDGAALAAFHSAAVRLTQPFLDRWRERWAAGAGAAAARTADRIEALRGGDGSHLAHAQVHRQDRPPQEVLGMCGRLAPYKAS
ncbi:cupin domain-containing protein [Pseudonocardia sp. HH130630-07]|uniref:cupin domain-containing protein n=1 Tax=Pseudonocardia sp. HH130630-07 TaxID=1690815 RepID=UPI000814F6CB|nr:cupin domain-containing protein [Pseudonocardia sp. HH130630-07]ANY09260.1 cupin [Pseudonocardia sp. HH130630-07]